MLEHLPVAAALLVTLATSTGMADPIPPPSAVVIVRNVELFEGDLGKTAFEAEVSISGGIPALDPYVVDLSAVASSATVDDFDLPPVRLSFKSGGPPQRVHGLIAGDTIFEGDESFWIHGEQAPGLYKPLIVHDGVVTIRDDDATKAPRLTLPPPSRVPESNDGWNKVVIPVVLSAPQTFPVTFDFATSGGRPVNDATSINGDYRAVAGTVTLLPGETVAQLPVEIFGDFAWEPEATFTLSLGNVKGAIADPASTQVTITNDDSPTTVEIDDGVAFEGNQGTTPATVALLLTAPASGAGQVWLSLTGGSARAGEDFVDPGPQLFTPEAGAVKMLVTLDVLGDTRPECDEGILLQYRGVDMGDDTLHTARLLILDDDGFPKDDPRCPDPFVHTDGGSPIGRPVDAGMSPKPPVDANVPPSPNDGGDVDGDDVDGGKRLPSRRGCCSVASGPSTPSSVATLLLAAAALFATRRRARRR